MATNNRTFLKIKPKASVFLVCLALGISVILHNGDIYGAQSEYDVIARNFLSFVQSNKQISSILPMKGSELDSSNPIPVAHLVTLHDGGYILISASKNLTPIKAYSLQYDFDTLPESYKNYLLFELEYSTRTLAEQNKTLYKSSGTITANQERWEFLSNYSKKTRFKTYQPNTFLIQTTWKQKHLYNKFCPQSGGEPVKVGCTNVALGQLMKYYTHPPSGKGVETYTWNGQKLKGIFYKDYHWENMPNSLSSITPEFQIDETARLLRDIAYANHSEFGVEATSANASIVALTKYFGYAKGIQTMTNASESAFFAVLKNEIDALRPVLLEFPGHMTIADGYSSNPTGREIHVNFGWGGHSDGYYFLDETVVTESYPNPFPTEPGKLEIFYNIKPCSLNDCDTNRESEDALEGITINAKFNDQRDTDEYRVYLKGQTAILGSRKLSQYSNQSFILSIFDYQHNLVAANDGEASVVAPSLVTNLAAGIYTLRFSLCKEIDVCYPYEPYIYYTATIYTQALTTAEKNAALALDISPIINNTFEDIILGTSDGPYKILIDAVDEDGDTITLNVTGTNNNITASIDTNEILTIVPKDNTNKEASKITVSASAGNKTVQKSFIVLIADDNIAFGKQMTLSGLFENQSTFNKHRVILDGNCTLSGDRGYANQGFYTSVMDLNEQFIVEPIDDYIQGYFLNTQFLIGASLAYGGSQYTYQLGTGDIYTIEIFCPESNLDIEDAASMLHISLQGTGLKNPPILSIDSDKPCGAIPLEVQFYSYSQDLDGTILSYQWDFDNGYTSTQEFPSHTFMEPGNHVVCCTATDNDGLSAYDTISIQVNRDKIKIGDQENTCQEASFEQCLNDGQNRTYMYNTSCCPYNSFDFLSELKIKNKTATLRRRAPKSGSFTQNYWFFGRISGKKFDFPEETEFSEEITIDEDAFYAVDIAPN